MKHLFIILLSTATVFAQTATKTTKAKLGEILTSEGVPIESTANLDVEDVAGFEKQPPGTFDLRKKTFSGVNAGFYRDGDRVFFRFSSSNSTRQTPNGPFNLIEFSGNAPASVTVSFDVRLPEPLKGDGKFEVRPYFYPEQPGYAPMGVSGNVARFGSDSQAGEWTNFTGTYQVRPGTTDFGLVLIYNRVTGSVEVSNIKVSVP